MTRLRVRSATFYGSRGDASAAHGVPVGFVIDTGGLTGLDGGTAIRRNTVDLPLAHGEFDVPGYQSGRVISVSGRCYARSEQEMQWFKSQLTGLLADGDADQITYDQDALTTFATGRLTGQTSFARLLQGFISTYQIQFWCANPRLYGTGRLFPAASSVAAYHYGNFPATPVLTVAGTATGYTITGPAGKLFTVTQDVVAGHPHTIDMATGFLSIDGAVVFGGVSRADTWAIPAGAQVPMTVTPLSGSLTLAAAVSDTYI